MEIKTFIITKEQFEKIEVLSDTIEATVGQSPFVLFRPGRLSNNQYMLEVQDYDKVEKLIRADLSARAAGQVRKNKYIQIHDICPLVEIEVIVEPVVITETPTTPEEYRAVHREVMHHVAAIEIQLEDPQINPSEYIRRGEHPSPEIVTRYNDLCTAYDAAQKAWRELMDWRDLAADARVDGQKIPVLPASVHALL